MTLDLRIQEYTESLQAQNLLRVRQIAHHGHTEFIHFDTNDYLSLTTDQGIAKAYQDGYTTYPTGSGGSMLLNGYHHVHHELEQAFATLLGVDECILFSSGYAANLAIASLLGKIGAACIVDKAIHASVYDGLTLSKVHCTRYLHNDVDDLERKLKSNPHESVIITEGIFSMSGQLAPLSSIAKIGEHYNSVVLVDEAHSFGILGAQGRGAVAHYGLTQNKVPLRIIPFGKALASQGALIAGQKSWINGLLQAARSLIYSTALSPALGYGLLKTLEVVVRADDRRAKLNQLTAYFKEKARNSPFRWGNSSSPIQQLQLGCPKLALHYSNELKKAGLCCSPVRSPTVSPKQTGLRIILNFDHQEEHINRLFKALDRIYESTHH
ncbi:aminotransferase class I/II-fold pyridoxal phosphate-dependent enzyme [Legionella worsleiensis]|uniref:8-amino-7-oxononanoate synthase n=1 Tax=Legionella worsleiensis TaxID=45076 RepID=A0A0W1A6A5_9GAMM|nr:8-amino-7-oxononanoate synthase [Legionella worsleiensis]KTD76879.1 8-amino-7-oxononanoate synthase [Legionella worsleiensis]STY33451.1 8-amino-7-oxononanoate synthase [Legionella worsleiensis]